jgi:hypothetical protein
MSCGGEELDGGNSKGPFENMGWRTWKIENQVTKRSDPSPSNCEVEFPSPSPSNPPNFRTYTPCY